MKSLEELHNLYGNLRLQEGRVKSHSFYVPPKTEKLAKLSLSMSAQIKQQYSNLSRWEKLFVANFYESEKQSKPSGKDKYEKVRRDINFELEKLYLLAEDEDYFKIDPTNNPELDRELEGEINALIRRGEEELVRFYKSNPRLAKNEMAKKISASHRAEYKHIVDFIKSTSYEPAFKALMLLETLNRTYKKIEKDGDDKTIINKRIKHKSLVGHMTLNEEVLKVIYNELDNYSNFANLYFAGVAISNKVTSQKSKVNINGLNTFGMGKWLKFEGKTTNKETYIKNAQDLSALVQNTPWCTKSLASSQLEQGDFFVFVDNGNNPHIAVKMNGNTVDEVRGILNGNAQELEPNYRPVAIEFLTKNKNIKNGDKWLKKEEWNNRLLNWNSKIQNNTITEGDVPLLLRDVLNKKS